MSKCKPKPSSGIDALSHEDVRVFEDQSGEKPVVVIQVPTEVLARNPKVQAMFQDIVSLSALDRA